MKRLRVTTMDHARATMLTALRAVRVSVRVQDDGEVVDSWSERHPQGEYVRWSDVERILGSVEP